VTRYTLPDLPYDYSALEPHITGHILELHHDKHHRAYVEGANRGIDQLLEARQKGGIERVPTIERALAFNVSGHVLHSIFWQNLAPEGARKPAGELAEAIERDFGSLASLRGQMIELAKTTMGSGWAALVFEPVTRRLGTMQIHDHQSEVTQGSVPLLVLDAWEHAYYLQYETDKEAYFKAIWNVFDWDDVAARYQRAQRTELAISNGASGR